MEQLDLFKTNDRPLDLVELLKHRKRKPLVIEREFWTSKQRQAHSLHEVSYRACFKPQLPRFFISQLTRKGDIVFDPFAGRGTTLIEAALLGRQIVSNDINPLSEILTRPRVEPPSLEEIEKRLGQIKQINPEKFESEESQSTLDLSVFYHHETERELRKLRSYLINKKLSHEEDFIDRWIRMVATNRLTGHSTGFFSVYTLPPNQAVSIERQREINAKLGNTPSYRDVFAIIARKSKQLLSELTVEESALLHQVAKTAQFFQMRAQNLYALPDGCIQLTVTSPPFLDVVQYKDDNWLRCWFNNIDVDQIAKKMSVTRSLDAWEKEMQMALNELFRVTKPNGYVAFEVGEVRNGKISLEEIIKPISENAGFEVAAVLINKQVFTKTSNIWGIKNNLKGTNSNRVVLLRKS